MKTIRTKKNDENVREMFKIRCQEFPDYPQKDKDFIEGNLFNNEYTYYNSFLKMYKKRFK